MDISYLNNFKTVCKCDWFNPTFSDNNSQYFTVQKFSYTLTRYTPSVYAIIQFVVNTKDLDSFNKIENLDVVNRKVEIKFEDSVYNKNLPSEKFFSGPFKFVCIDYISQTVMNNRLITLHCVDEVFYKMARVEGDKFKSFGKKKISDIVTEIIKDNGGKMKIIADTDYEFRWLQTRMTDFKMIKSLLPYSRSSNKMDCYTFFMFNNEGYFAPMGYNKTNSIQIPVNNIIGMADDINSNNASQQLIDKYGSLDKLFITHHGYSNNTNAKPTTMVNQAYDENNIDCQQHAGVSTTYITTALEDNTLNEIYISNLRHIIHSFNRVVNLNCYAIPDITPLDCVKLTDTDKTTGKGKEYDGVYYVHSITYSYGDTVLNHAPTMSLILTSEININNKGNQKPEGQSMPTNNTTSSSQTGNKTNVGKTNTVNSSKNKTK